MVDEPDTGARIPVTLLTGFLGSGKTTVLNHLLQQSELGNAAVLNEFGEIGLDHDLVEAVTETLVLLQNGCLCCTIRGDLIQTLGAYAWNRDAAAGTFLVGSAGAL
jgi:G3E family GTPase